MSEPCVVQNMSDPLPLIYAPTMSPSRLTIGQRSIAAAICIGCAALLGVAYQLVPDSSGVGTHLGLGLPRCAFLYYSGLPCPSCGMTTSFSYFAHGNLLASFWVQPMASLMALLTTMIFWAAGYCVFTGRDLMRLARRWASRWIVLSLTGFAIAAWGWKIFIHLRGIDGWR